MFASHTLLLDMVVLQNITITALRYSVLCYALCLDSSLSLSTIHLLILPLTLSLVLVLALVFLILPLILVLQHTPSHLLNFSRGANHQNKVHNRTCDTGHVV